MNDFFGSELIINGDVKFIEDGEDPVEDTPLIKTYAKVLKEVYQPERSKREDMNNYEKIKVKMDCNSSYPVDPKLYS